MDFNSVDIFCDRCGIEFIRDDKDKYEDTKNVFVSVNYEKISRKYGVMQTGKFDYCHECWGKMVFPGL